MNPDANRHISATLEIISLTILTSAAKFNAELKNKRQIKINVETEKAEVKASVRWCGVFYCLPWQLSSPLKSVNERGFFTTSLLKMKRRKCCHLEYNQQEKEAYERKWDAGSWKKGKILEERTWIFNRECSE